MNMYLLSLLQSYAALISKGLPGTSDLTVFPVLVGFHELGLWTPSSEIWSSSAIVVVGRTMLTQKVSAALRTSRRSSVASATTLALGRGHTTCARFLR